MKNSYQPPTISRAAGIFTAFLFILLLSHAADSHAQCRAVFVSWPDSTGNNIQFEDSSSATLGNANSWSWTFGDGGTSSLQNPVHTYNTTGFHQVCVTVGFTTGCSSTFCDSVYSGPPAPSCYPSFTFNVNSSTNVVSFTDMSSANQPIIAWYWTFGDGDSSLSVNPAHTYLNPGTYTVCLTITTQGMSCQNTSCQVVVVSSPRTCYAGFSSSGGGAAPAVMSFYDSSWVSAGTITSWSWDFGDSTSLSGFQNPSHTYTANGSYQVCLTITTSAGCTDTYCSTVTIGSLFTCNAGFSYNGNSGTTVSFADLSYSGDPIISWNWDFGDSTGSSFTNPSHTYAAAGTYNVCLTIATLPGCTNTYCTTVSTGNTGSCAASFTDFSLPGGLFVFTNTSSAGNATVCYWAYGDGSFATSFGMDSVIHSFATGTFNVCLTIQDSLSGCSDTYCAIVNNSNPACAASFTSAADSLTGLTVTFSGASTGNSTQWIWNFGDGNTIQGTGALYQFPVHTYTSFGRYTVCLAVADAGWTCTDSICNYVDVVDPCTPSFVSAPDSVNVLGGPTQNFYLNSPCGTPTAVFWDFGDGSSDSSGNPQPSHTYTTAGWYNVCGCIVVGVDTFCDCHTVYAARLSSGIPEIGALNQFETYPNPFSTELHVDFGLTRESIVKAGLYDLIGNEIKTIDRGTKRSGSNRYQVYTGDLTPGFYLIRLDAGGSSVTRKVFLIK